MRGSRLPEYRRVLGEEARHHDDHGRDLHARLHINQLKGAWGWFGAPEKDAQGYPVRLEGDQNARSQVLNVAAGMSGIAPYAGRFRLYGRGTGRIQLGWRQVLEPTATARLPRETIDGTSYWYVDFDYDPAGFGGPVTMEITDLPVRGDHLRDMALVHHAHLQAWRSGAIFMPEAVADLSLLGRVQAARGGGRGALRFMQSLQTNIIWTPGQTGYLDQTEAQRDRRFVGPDHYSFPRIQHDGPGEKMVPTAMPIEHLVALCNATGTDLWYNLSADILDARAVQIAEYVRDNLAPELEVYWEYANEVWNGAPGFESRAYAVAHGQATFPGLGKTAAAYEWDVYRSMQLFAQIRAVFADAPRRSRYVGTFWAIEASNAPDGRIRENSYAARYFAAERARREPDIGALPEEIITDMAVGGYFGTPPGDIFDYVLETYPDTTRRARALTRIVERGMDGDLVALAPAHLDRPVTGVAPEAPIGVYALVAGDIAAGLDPLRELDRVLRLDGRHLQYRGLDGGGWRTVLAFDSVPGRDLAAMIREVQLMGYGRRFYGRDRNGFNGQIRHAIRDRVQAHSAFAEARGLDLHFYEGGMGTDGTPGSGLEGAAALMREYHYGGWAARVMHAFLERAAPDVTQMVWYKTHDRTYDSGYRGLKEYYGQDAAAAPKWRLIEALVAAGAPGQ